MQACGVSLIRLLRPIAAARRSLATAATAYEMIVALPDANQTFREITFNVVASGGGKQRQAARLLPGLPQPGDLRPRPAAGGGWRDVFLADTSRADRRPSISPSEGRLVVDREKQTVQLELEDGTSHTTVADRSRRLRGRHVRSAVMLDLDPATVFPRPPCQGRHEMTSPSCAPTIAEAAKTGGAGATPSAS